MDWFIGKIVNFDEIVGLEFIEMNLGENFEDFREKKL